MVAAAQIPAPPAAPPYPNPGLPAPERVSSMLTEAKGYFQDARRAMQHRLPALLERMAFYRGDQWGYPTQYGWLQDITDSSEARECYNYVRPTVRSAVADMLRNVPNPEAVAAHEDMRSVTRALAVQTLCRSFLHTGVLAFEEMMRGMTAAQVHGASWIKVYWDPNKGTFDPSSAPPQLSLVSDSADPDQLPTTDDFGVPLGQQKTGEIAFEFCDVIDVLPDPHAKRLSDARHAFHRKLIPVGTLLDRFPKDAFGEDTKGRWSIYGRDFGPRERDFLEDDGRGGGVGGLGSSDTPYGGEGNQLAELVEFWERPTHSFPGGRLIVFSGDVVVAIGPLPYKFPWVLLLGQNIVPSALYADGVVHDLVPLQRTVNFNASKRKEWVDVSLQPWVMNPKGSGVDPSDFENKAGRIVEYNKGYLPEWMNPPAIPAAMFTIEEQLVALIKDISTYSDITRGDASPGIETGVAMAYLHEFSQGVHEPDIAMFRIAITDALRLAVELARDFYQEGRLIRLLGENKRWTSKVFRAQDYDFATDLVIEPYSNMPNSRALRMQMVTDWQQRGLLGDTPDAQRARRLMDIDTDDHTTVNDDAQNRERARMEQEAIVENPMAQLVVKGFQNHDIHLDEHGRFQNSVDYDALPPMAQALFDQHVEQHEMARADALNVYAQESAMLQNPSQSAAGGAPPKKAPGVESSMTGNGSAMPGASGDLGQNATQGLNAPPAP